MQMPAIAWPPSTSKNLLEIAVRHEASLQPAHEQLIDVLTAGRFSRLEKLVLDLGKDDFSPPLAPLLASMPSLTDLTLGSLSLHPTESLEAFKHARSLKILRELAWNFAEDADFSDVFPSLTMHAACQPSRSAPPGSAASCSFRCDACARPCAMVSPAGDVAECDPRASRAGPTRQPATAGGTSGGG
jgi:hypothetical protein